MIALQATCQVVPGRSHERVFTRKIFDHRIICRLENSVSIAGLARVDQSQGLGEKLWHGTFCASGVFSSAVLSFC